MKTSTSKIVFKDQFEQITNMKKNMLEAIWELILSRDLKQEDAAEVLGVSQPRISNIKNGKTENFSIDKCIIMLNLLGHKFDFDYQITSDDVECTITAN